MHFIKTITSIIVVASLFVACNSKSVDKHSTVVQKKQELEKLKKQSEDLKVQIDKLQADIVKLDPSAAKAEKAKLVSLTEVQSQTFRHFIDLQGKVEAENIANVAPRGQGGMVRAVYIKKGDFVRKGQLLLKLDDAIIRQQIAQVRTQLEYAKNLYQRQQNLWKENIGTEVQLISAKNNVEATERQLSVLHEQLSTTNVYAALSGVADEVSIKVGELFGGGMGNGIRIVNTSSLRVRADVPESYASKVKPGSAVDIEFPGLNKTIMGHISVTGKLIDPATRSFYVQIKIPSTNDLRPNQIATVKIEDYVIKNAVAVPINVVQNDEKGKYILVAVKENSGLIARKKNIEVGELYGDTIEIKTGIQAGDQIITDGYQSLYDGQLITTVPVQ
ncbi:MAG TPA: efflux RND transporter periplasmic adaptor subunit [Chitinophagaceae bacterium]|nr:efflux RND transporter periplasmic adaptor subunit [Chitinophagaceae bacterium]